MFTLYYALMQLCVDLTYFALSVVEYYLDLSFVEIKKIS